MKQSNENAYYMKYLVDDYLFCASLFANLTKPLVSTQFLESNRSAQFLSNPNQTHLIQLIKVFRITRNFQAGVIWSWLELNSAELQPSRNWVETTVLNVRDVYFFHENTW